MYISLTHVMMKSYFEANSYMPLLSVRRVCLVESLTKANIIKLTAVKEIKEKKASE